MSSEKDINLKKVGNYIFAGLHNIQRKAGELKYELERAEREKGVLETLIKELNLCEVCFAKGEFYYHTSPDEGHMKICPNCEGKGRIIP